MKRLSLLLFCFSFANAQTAANTFAITGKVLDATTGKPLRNYVVSTFQRAGQGNGPLQSITDEGGAYRIPNLPVGTYSIDCRSAERFGAQKSRRVTVGSQDVENVDFRLMLEASIVGRVLDDNKEPVPNMQVSLVAYEYFKGSAGYFYRNMGSTDDRGQFTIAQIEPGTPYYLLAQKQSGALPTRSEVPLDPARRAAVPARTFYPNSPVKEGAMRIVLRPGEAREGVDIQLKKVASLCVEGVLSTPNGPAAITFTLEPQDPGSGLSEGRGHFNSLPTGHTAADGRYRICELPAGDYRLSALVTSQNVPSVFAVQTLTVGDKDIRNFNLVALPGQRLRGEVVWSGAPPEKPATAKANISIDPLRSARFMGSDGFVRADVPGEFSIPSVLVDDYVVRASFTQPDAYIKDVTYNDHSVLYEPLRMGMASTAAGLRVVLATDGGTIAVSVADKKGNPSGDAQIILMPADAPSEAELSARVIRGRTDQTGTYKSPVLAPGKYLVTASEEEFGPTPESISKLWQARANFKEVELTAKSSTAVSLLLP